MYARWMLLAVKLCVCTCVRVRCAWVFAHARTIWRQGDDMKTAIKAFNKAALISWFLES